MVWGERRLAREIKMTFSGTNYPGDDKIFRVKYDTGSRMEWPPSEFALFLGKEWRDVEVKKYLRIQ